ncbi:hypothetical protein REPUB_Repub20aG0090600 [Reevesia pubescens]
MSTASNLIKLSLPFYSFKSSTTKLPIPQRTTYSNNVASTLIKVSPWQLLAERKNQDTDPPELEFSTPKEFPSGPNYRPPSVPLEVPEISRTPEMDPSDTPLEFTTSDPPPLGRPNPDLGPDFPNPPLGPPPTGPEVVPVPPPGRQPPPEVDSPLPPDLVPPPSTPPDYVPPPSRPPDIPTPRIPPDIPPTKGPSFVF